MNANPLFLIYSKEHDAWWRPKHNGYTPNRAEAGKYTLAETIDILRQANHTDLDHPQEFAIPVDSLAVREEQ